MSQNDWAFILALGVDASNYIFARWIRSKFTRRNLFFPCIHYRMKYFTCKKVLLYIFKVCVHLTMYSQSLCNICQRGKRYQDKCWVLMCTMGRVQYLWSTYISNIQESSESLLYQMQGSSQWEMLCQQLIPLELFAL